MKQKVVQLSTGIVIDPSIRSGRPVILGTRVPVDVLVGRVAAGISIPMIADKYGVTEQDIYNALGYAAQRLADEQVWVTAG